MANLINVLPQTRANSAPEVNAPAGKTSDQGKVQSPIEVKEEFAQQLTVAKNQALLEAQKKEASKVAAAKDAAAKVAEKEAQNRMIIGHSIITPSIAPLKASGEISEANKALVESQMSKSFMSQSAPKPNEAQEKQTPNKNSVIRSPLVISSALVPAQQTAQLQQKSGLHSSMENLNIPQGVTGAESGPAQELPEGVEIESLSLGERMAGATTGNWVGTATGNWMGTKGAPLATAGNGKNQTQKSADKLSPVKNSTGKISTDTFLNLRELQQKGVAPAPTVPLLSEGVGLPALGGLKKASPKAGANTDSTPIGLSLASPQTAHLPQGQQTNLLTKTIDAHVTQGAEQKLVLSHDALNQMANQVAQFKQAQSNGEIKLRLRPDHLGELQMSVRTQGQNVSIHFKAQDEQSKSIIEQSLGALKDNLAMQSLTLGKVDVVTQPHMNTPIQLGLMDSNQMNMDFGSQGRQSPSDGFSERQYSGEERPQFQQQSFARARPLAARAVNSDVLGRLDMIA